MKIGDVDVQNIPLSQIMEHIAYVSQDNYLFHLSIRENIRIGKPDATNREIENAAKKAACHDFIESLPSGYDTVVGDSGSNLSGGEKQRFSCYKLADRVLNDRLIFRVCKGGSFI